MTLEQIWKSSNGKSNLKVRYQGWDHSIKYFSIFGVSVDKTQIFGEYDNGDHASFPAVSDHWCIYHKGLENNAAA